MRSILVVGGGIAGVECALTLARTVDDATVSLVTEEPTLRLLPNLVYVPFGIDSHEVLVPLAEVLDDSGVLLLGNGCHGIDVEARSALVGDAWTTYDAIVVASGVEPERTTGFGLRSVADALRLRERLSRLSPGERQVVAVRVLPTATWMAPAVEFTLLLATWLRASGMNRGIDVLFVTEEREPLNIFGPEANDLLAGRMVDVGVEMLSSMPVGRVEDIEADVLIDFAGLRARSIVGMPDPGPEGFYVSDDDGRVAPGVFIVGDASSNPFKAGFATAWEARQVAAALGGDLLRLGTEIDGIPIASCEYQMDLGGESTMHARFNARMHFAGSHIGGHVSVWVSPDRPEKLLGTLLHAQLVESGHFPPVRTTAPAAAGEPPKPA